MGLLIHFNLGQEFRRVNYLCCTHFALQSGGRNAPRGGSMLRYSVITSISEYPATSSPEEFARACSLM
jgi:hypothetical protein